jgi:arginine/lysine/ornithine decarboxylase
MHTPLLDALSLYHDRADRSCHTPGHKNGRLVPARLARAWGPEVWKWDATEVPGLDALAHPQGVLRDSMAEWARIRHAAAAQYLVGGTSIGLKAAILALARGQEIFVPRHAHHSILEALVLADARPLWLDVTLNAAGLPLGVAPQTLAAAAQAHPSCRLMAAVHPTYHGMTWRNAELFALARRLGIAVISDSAHGAHFDGVHTPAPALELGAMVSVESAHKTLPVLTQASVMLMSPQAPEDDLRRAVALLGTTSPSYLLMASLEAAGDWLETQAPALMAAGLTRIRALKEALAAAPWVELAQGPDWQADPFRLYLHPVRASAETLEAALVAAGVMPEMTDGYGVLLLLPLDGGDDDLRDRILTACADPRLETPAPARALCYLAAPPPAVLTPRQAWFAPRRTLPLDQCLDQIAAEVLEAYPPGIPLVAPGERITSRVLEVWQASGGDMSKPFAVCLQ